MKEHIFYKKGQTDERKRIIKIIEEYKERECNKDCVLNKTDTDCLPCYTAMILIDIMNEIKFKNHKELK